MADGVAAIRAFGAARMLRATRNGMRDQLAAIRGRAPVYLPLAGPPGSDAAMTTDDADAGYRRLVPAVTTWQNRFAARLLLRVATYRPNRVAGRISCPLLVCVCTGDTITPPGAALLAAERAPRGEAIRYDGRHFDIYVGDLFDLAVADQTAFLARNLQP
jgi:pimeloyl-ACP methyl ester carboxylesterase